MRQPVEPAEVAWRQEVDLAQLGLYKIFVRSKVFVHESIIFVANILCLGISPPPLITHSIVQYFFPPTRRCIAMCILQYWEWQYLVKANAQLLLVRRQRRVALPRTARQLA